MENNEVADLFDEEIKSKYEKKGKKRFKKAFWVFLGIFIVLFIGVGTFLYITYNTSSMSLISKSVNTLNEKYLDSYNILDDIKIFNKGIISGDFNFKLNKSNDEELNSYANIFNDLIFKYEYKKNSSKEVLSLQIDQNENMLTRLTAISNEITGYIYLEKIYDKYIEINSLASGRINNDITTLDLAYSYKFIKEKLIKEVKKMSFNRKDSSIKIDEKERKVKELYISLTEEELFKILNEVLDKAKDDEIVLKVLKMLYMDIEEFTFKAETKNKYNYSIYYDGITGTVYGFDIGYTNSSDTKDYAIAQFRLDKYPTIELITNKILVKLEFLYEDKEQVINIYNGNNLKGQIRLSDNKINIRLENGKNVCTIKNNIIKNIAAEYLESKSIEGSIVITENNETTLDISYSGNINMNEDVVIDERIGKSIDYRNISDDEEEQIQTNLAIILLKLMGYSE